MLVFYIQDGGVKQKSLPLISEEREGACPHIKILSRKCKNSDNNKHNNRDKLQTRKVIVDVKDNNDDENKSAFLNTTEGELS